MLLGGGLHGRIEPVHKVRSPLGVSGNQGFYHSSSQQPATPAITRELELGTGWWLLPSDGGGTDARGFDSPRSIVRIV
jgi:hypothetical protein